MRKATRTANAAGKATATSGTEKSFPYTLRNPRPYLRFFRLEPIDFHAEDWQGSTYCGQVHVEAFDVEDARHIAGQHFAKPPSSQGGSQVIYRPWWNPALVRVVEASMLDPLDGPLISLNRGR
jgi:hypothetical protein